MVLQNGTDEPIGRAETENGLVDMVGWKRWDRSRK